MKRILTFQLIKPLHLRLPSVSSLSPNKPSQLEVKSVFCCCFCVDLPNEPHGNLTLYVKLLPLHCRRSLSPWATIFLLGRGVLLRSANIANVTGRHNKTWDLAAAVHLRDHGYKIICIIDGTIKRQTLERATGSNWESSVWEFVHEAIIPVIMFPARCIRRSPSLPVFPEDSAGIDCFIASVLFPQPGVLFTLISHIVEAKWNVARRRAAQFWC